MNIYDINGNLRNKLYKKKWLIIGDSITVGGNYTTQIVALNNMTAIYGAGNGYQTGYSSGLDYCILEKIDAITGIPDIITIALGTNDYGNNCEIGSIEDDPNTQSLESYTFIGCYKKLINMLYEKYGLVPIVLFTPFPRSSGKHKNQAGYTLNDYATAIKNVGEYYSYPVFDVCGASGLPIGTLAEKDGDFLYTKDGLHINKKGSAVVVPKMIEYMDIAIQKLIINCTGVSISGGELKVNTGEAITIYTAYTPDGCTDIPTWEISDENIATIRVYGEVWCEITGVSSGECTITVTCGDKTASKKVTVS